MQNASKRQNRQLGGVLAFILIGFALVALLGAGIYLSKQQGRVASRTDTVATTDSSSADTAKDNTSAKTVPQPAPAPATPAPAVSASSAPAATATVPTTGPTGPAHIAQTGPTDVLIPILGLSLLAAVLLAYHRSVGAVRTQALKQ